VSSWVCPGCGYVYDEERGHPREGFPPGTPWSEVPDDWACPDCGTAKAQFEMVVIGYAAGGAQLAQNA